MVLLTFKPKHEIICDVKSWVGGGHGGTGGGGGNLAAVIVTMLFVCADGCTYVLIVENFINITGLYIHI